MLGEFADPPPGWEVLGLFGTGRKVENILKAVLIFPPFLIPHDPDRRPRRPLSLDQCTSVRVEVHVKPALCELLAMISAQKIRSGPLSGFKAGDWSKTRIGMLFSEKSQHKRLKANVFCKPIIVVFFLFLYPFPPSFNPRFFLKPF